MNNKKNKKTWNMFPYVIYQIVHEPPNSLNLPPSLHLKKNLTPGKTLYYTQFKKQLPYLTTPQKTLY